MTASALGAKVTTSCSTKTSIVDALIANIRLIQHPLMRDRPTPTPEDITIANAIIARVKVGKRRLTMFAKGVFPTGSHLAKKYFGRTPSSCCNSEAIWLHDRLREMVGLSYARDELPTDKVEARKFICHGCPAYRHLTDSCGRLILDALSSQPVDIDGEMINPCGCIISLKAMFASEACPANKWPK